MHISVRHVSHVSHLTHNSIILKGSDMKLARMVLLLLAFAAFGPLGLLTAGAPVSESLTTAPVLSQDAKVPKSDKLVYADFETVQDNRPVSSRGGQIQLQSYAERP